MAYDRLYPLNTTDVLLSQIASYTFAPVRDVKLHKRPPPPAHFLPDPFAQPLPTPMERRQAFEANMAAYAAEYQKTKTERPD